LQSLKTQPKDTEFVNEVCDYEDNDDSQFLDLSVQDVFKAKDNYDTIKGIYFYIFTLLYNITKLNFYGYFFL